MNARRRLCLVYVCVQCEQGEIHLASVTIERAAQNFGRATDGAQDMENILLVVASISVCVMNFDNR
jgi:purine nucleoside permease